MTPEDQARNRLATAMDSRRVDLRLRWSQVAARANISVGHLTRIRNGISPLTEMAKASLETALEWPRGHIDQLLAMFITGEAGPEADAAGTGEAEPDSALSAVEKFVQQMIAAENRRIEIQLREEFGEQLAERDEQIADLSEQVRKLRERKPDNGDEERRNAS